MKKIFCFMLLLFMTTIVMAAGFTKNYGVDFTSVSNTNTNMNTLAFKTSFNVLLPAQADSLIRVYLIVKNALVADNPSLVREAGKALVTTLKQLEKSADKNTFGKAGNAAIKSALLISNAADIKGQRSAFKDLSDSVYQLVKKNGSSSTLYFDYCPMAKASWLSDKKAIANPYYGKSMLSCGTVKETLNP